MVAAFEVRDTDLVVTLTPLERVAALRREVRVPVTAIERACVDSDPWGSVRGFRIAGTGIPGVAAYGVRLIAGERPDFAAVHGREPAVRIELASWAPYRRLLVTVADPAASVAQIEAVVRGRPGA